MDSGLIGQVLTFNGFKSLTFVKFTSDLVVMQDFKDYMLKLFRPLS